jgi:tetratricopeptide (TPR) repeat protein
MSSYLRDTTLDREKYLNDFESLRYLRRFFRKKRSFEIGVIVFETLLQQNITNKEYVLINLAYLYDELGNIEKANESIKQALSTASNQEFIIDKAGNFFLQIAEKGHANPLERAKSVFQSSLTDQNFTIAINDQIANIEITYNFYDKFNKLIRDLGQGFLSKARNEKQIVLSQLATLLNEMKYLLESKKITLNTSILGDINKGKTTKILKQIEKESVKQNDYELSNLCKIITIKINEIFIVQNGLDSISNFSNYYEIASILNEAKKQNFYLDINAEKYYEDYETYIRKAIDFGEETLKNLTHNTELKPHYNSIPNAYILYGNFRIESALKDYGQVAEFSNKAGDFTSVTNLAYIAYQFFTEKINSPSEFLLEKKDIIDLLKNNKTIEILGKSQSNPEDVGITHSERITLSEDSSKLFVSKILKNAEKLLSYIEALIDRFKQLSIDEHDITFLERTIKPALNIAKQEFCKQKINELSSKCSLLILKCAEVLLITKNTTDSIANAYRLCGNIKIELAIEDYQRAFAILHSYNFKNIASESILLNSISQYVENKFDSTSEISFLILGLLVFEHLNENIKDKCHIQNCIRRIFVKFYKYLGRDDKAAIYESPYIQLINLTKNDQEYFTNILRSQDETIPKVKKLLDEINKLVENSKIPIDHIFFDKVIKYALHKGGEEFRMGGNNELFYKCVLAEIKCCEIFIASKHSNDTSNFTNYWAIANILYTAKKQGFDSFPDAEKYYAGNYYKEIIEKAIELGEKAIKNRSLENRLPPSYYSSLADAYRLRGNLKLEEQKENSILSFREDFQRAIGLFKFLSDTIYKKDNLDWSVDRLAECYLHLKDYENAINEYKILFDKSKGKKYQAALKLGDIYDATSSYHEANNWYLKCIDISENDPAAYDKLIHLHRNNNNYDEAILWQHKMIKNASSHVPNEDFLYFRLGTLYREKGDDVHAIDTFRHVTERQPNSTAAFDQLISLLTSREEHPEAIEWLHRKLSINKHPFWDYCRLGDCYLFINCKDKALEYYKKALSIDSKDVPGLKRLAKWYELDKQYKNAIDILNEIIGLVDDEQADGLYKWMGDLFCKLEDKQSALVAYYKSLEIKPQQYEIYDRIELITKKRFQFAFDRINELQNEYKNLPSPDLAARIINLSLSTRNRKCASIVHEYLGQSNYKPGSFEYSDRLALVYEIEGLYDLAIKERQKFVEFETLDLKRRLKNLSTLVELIKQNRLYDHKNIEKLCIKEIGKLIKENIPTIDKRIESDVSEDNTRAQMIEDETKIYTFRDELYFLAIYYKEIGYREKAHTYIRKLLGSSLYELQNDKVYLQAEAGIFYEERKLDEAQKVLNKIKGEDSYALMLLGKIKKCKKEFQSAIEYFKRAYKSSGEIFPADQIGATYREWAEELTLTEQERFEIKNKAIEWYQILSEKYQDDKIIRFGLAKSYLLKPLGKEHIQDGVRIISNIIKSGIDSKSYITRNDIDKRSIRELLSLWSKNYDDTIKRIILGENKLTTNEYNHNLIIEESINIAKEQNIFELDAVNTFKIIFIENRNKRVRNAICKYFMKFVIWFSI